MDAEMNTNISPFILFGNSDDAICAAADVGISILLFAVDEQAEVQTYWASSTVIKSIRD